MSASRADAAADDNEEAEWLEVPKRLITAVEHPGVIKNIDAAIATLGGQSRVDRFMATTQNDQSRFLGLSFQPEDAFRRPLAAQVSSSSNLILKVTVPRRIRRKRKRGDVGGEKAEELSPLDSPFVIPRDAAYLLQSLQDNDEDYDVEPVGSVQDICRFRANLDYQFSMTPSKMANKFESDILPFRYDNLKRFELDTSTRGTGRDADVIPPPRLLGMGVPHHYMYLQNPYVEVDQTGQNMKNSFTPVKWHHQVLSYQQYPIPTHPVSSLSPESKLGRSVKDVIMSLRAMFAERPVTTRRALYNTLKEDVHKMHLERALEYCAYQFRSGPWRDCVISYGVDPRTDPLYRKYQTFNFQISPHGRRGAGQGSAAAYTKYPTTSPMSHIFDGKVASPDVKMFAVCDITDSLVQKVFSAEPRSSCEISREGWYQNGTWAKAKIILHEKMKALQEKRSLPDDYFDALLNYPESCSDITDTDRFKPEPGEPHALFSAFRGEMRTSLAGAITMENAAGSGDEIEDEIDDVLEQV